MVFETLIANLVALAQTSTMTSKHAAAILKGKQVLTSAVNYALPSAEILDVATKLVHMPHLLRERGECLQGRSQNLLIEVQRTRCEKCATSEAAHALYWNRVSAAC